MRIGFSGFLDDLVQCDTSLRHTLEQRTVAYSGAGWRATSNEELIAILHQITEFLTTGRSSVTSTRGYGLQITEERFNDIFGNRTQQTYFDAIHGTGQGLRGIIDTFSDELKEQMIRDSLYQLIDSFFVAEYGSRLERNYSRMHEDSHEYFRRFASVLPSSILEQSKQFIMGTSFIESEQGDIPVPRMREVYARHPQFLRANSVTSPN